MSVLNASPRSSAWHFSTVDSHPARAALESHLPAASTTPAILLLPIATEPLADCNLWQLFPSKLAVLLTVIPRDAIFAANGAAVELVSKSSPEAESASHWLQQATAAGVSVTALAPHVVTATSDWQTSLPELSPKRPGRNHDWLLSALQNSPAESLVPKSHEPTSTIALQAGIYQWHDYLDESHSCSQQIEGEGPGQLGDYWHAIMHRREPDASNSKYWFRHVGQQSIFPDLAQAADQILSNCKSSEARNWCEKLTAGGRWDPFAFVDFCSACESRTDELSHSARHIQFVEMALLLQETWDAAAGQD